MSLAFTNVRFFRGGFQLEADFTLASRVAVLIGPSGAGKTTLLELAAGLLRPSAGRVRLGGQTLADAATGDWIPPHRRGVGYLPQDLALFPHLTAGQNLRFARRGGRPGPTLEHVVEALELKGLEGRPVTRLSGGEQQRVALGRALLAGPRLLLLDEPLGRLNRELRSQVGLFLRRVIDEFSIPVVYVTHDPGEAGSMAGEVLRIEGGLAPAP